MNPRYTIIQTNAVTNERLLGRAFYHVHKTPLPRVRCVTPISGDNHDDFLLQIYPSQAVAIGRQLLTAAITRLRLPPGLRQPCDGLIFFGSKDAILSTAEFAGLPAPKYLPYFLGKDYVSR